MERLDAPKNTNKKEGSVKSGDEHVTDSIICACYEIAKPYYENEFRVELAETKPRTKKELAKASKIAKARAQEKILGSEYGDKWRAIMEVDHFLVGIKDKKVAEAKDKDLSDEEISVHLNKELKDTEIKLEKLESLTEQRDKIIIKKRKLYQKISVLKNKKEFIKELLEEIKARNPVGIESQSYNK